jgi:hypothetical protein
MAQSLKPQLTLQNYAGTHNENIEQTQARLLKGASWKKQRVVVILPSGSMLAAKVFLALRSLYFPPNQASIWILAQGFEVGEAYSNAIQGVLDHPELKDWEYILTVEHDNLPPPDGLVKLIERMEAHPEYACIGGLYYTKGEGGVAQIWGDPKDPVLNFRPQVPVDGQLVECCGTGMGFNLFRMSMFKDEKLRRPWFKTLNGTEGTGIGTQDLYAWADFRKHGYRCAIDCGVKVGHLDVQADFVW